MDVWGWVVVYVLGLTVLQVLLYRFLVDGGGTAANGGGLEEGEADLDGGERGREVRLDPLSARARPAQWSADGDRRLCPHCGAENESEAAFRRCWNCAEQL